MAITNLTEFWNGIRTGITANSIAFRSAMVRWLNSTGRNIEKECSHPDMGTFVPIRDFKNMYDRFGVAKRVVNIGPDACWEVPPSVFETSKNTNTDFEKRLVEIGSSLSDPLKLYNDNEKRNPFFTKLLEADRKMGIGRFGIILVGTDDKKKLIEPIEGFGTDSVSQKDLLFMRTFDETQVSVAAVETDESSVRYRKPTFYTITPNDVNSSDVGSNDTSTIQGAYRVHWHRIIHLSEGDVSHRPRMLSVWDHILGLRKLYLGSPEMYWKGAFQGLSIESEPGMEFEDPAQAKKDVEDYQEGLKRALFWTGAKSKTLSPSISDPTEQISVQIGGICIDIDCPRRIFEGSERGELSSSTDQIQWGEVTSGRRSNICIPKILVPVISHLIMMGILPKPTKYFVEWEGSSKLNAAEAATILLTRTQALTTFVQKDGEQAITLLDWLQEEFGYTKEKAEEVIKNSLAGGDANGNIHDDPKPAPLPIPAPGIANPAKSDLTAAKL